MRPPEFLVAGLLALRGKPVAALGLLLSSKVNQLTLLVGSLPVAYSVGAGQPATLPLDTRQVGEVVLTAAQSLFGLGVLASLSLSLPESALLVGLFAAQLGLGGVLRAGLHNGGAAAIELFQQLRLNGAEPATISLAADQPSCSQSPCCGLPFQSSSSE